MHFVLNAHTFGSTNDQVHSLIGGWEGAHARSAFKSFLLHSNNIFVLQHINVGIVRKLSSINTTTRTDIFSMENRPTFFLCLGITTI